jgi:hypothetical protein
MHVLSVPAVMLMGSNVSTGWYETISEEFIGGGINKLTAVTGTLRCVVVLSPSWPFALFPQHCTAEVVNSAHVWLVPADMALAVPFNPVTSTGVLR